MVLGANDGDQNDKGGYNTNEDTLDGGTLVATPSLKMVVLGYYHQSL